MNELEIYKKKLEVYKQDFVDAKYEISKMEFNEDDIKTFKEQKAQANRLIKNIDQTRKDYEKWHKKQIEDDINLLKSWVLELTDIVRDKQIGYDEWYSDLKVSRVAHAKEIFIDLLPDYDLSFELEPIWTYVYDDKLMTDLTDNKITKLVTEKLNNLLQILSLVDEKDYPLFEKSGFDITTFNKNKELLESLDIEPVVEPIIPHDNVTTIIINTSDLQKVQTLLASAGIWYE